MNSTGGPVGPEEYMEPACLLCGEEYGKAPEVRSVPQRRIIEKVNEYMSRRDYAAVERHLNYWLAEARLGRDQRGELTVQNEMIGHYRKTGNREAALESIEEALSLVEELDFGNSSSGAVTFINSATALSSFGENERALELFERAKSIIEPDPGADPGFLGGLYNNMGLVCAALKNYKRAYALYDRAILIMKSQPGGCLEEAVTLLNIADAKESELGPEAAEEEIAELLEKASILLNDPQVPHDGYYAFVCEKCAPTFSYYGFFADAEELKQRAEEIYERP